MAFWGLYPRKTGKGAAWQSWLKQRPPSEAVQTALAWQIRSPEWLRDAGDFVPHPATYLNQRRWEDEPRSLRVSAPVHLPAVAEKETRTVCFFHQQAPGKKSVVQAAYCRICREWSPQNGVSSPTPIAELWPSKEKP